MGNESTANLMRTLDMVLVFIAMYHFMYTPGVGVEAMSLAMLAMIHAELNSHDVRRR